MWRTPPVGASSSLATRPGAHNGARTPARDGRVAAFAAILRRPLRRPEPHAATVGVLTPHRSPIPSVRSDRHQADLPTQEEVPAQDARIPYPHVDTRWTSGSQGAPSQGSQAPHARAATVISRHRLRGRRRFAAVRSLGLRASSAGVRAQLAGNGLDVGRVGFALVGLRSAVRRNLLRRRLRAAVGPLLPRLRGHDLVLVAGTDALDLRFAALRDAVADATVRALERSRRALEASTADNGSMSASVEPPR
jgi:ribonuclease P protein component